MKDEELELLTSPLFTLIMKKDEYGGLTVADIKLSSLFMKLPMQYQHEIINEILGEGEPISYMGGSAYSLN